MRDATGGGVAMLVGLAYPLGNVVTLTLVVIAFSVRDWRVGVAGTVLAAAFGVARRGRRDRGLHARRLDAARPGRRVGLAWMALTGVAAWCPAPPAYAEKREGGHLLAPSLLALVAAGLLVLDHFVKGGDTPVYLAAATLLVAGMRVALTFRENLVAAGVAPAGADRRADRAREPAPVL